MEKKDVFAFVLKGLLQQLEPENTRQHTARDDDDRLKKLVREVLDEKNKTTAETELLHRVIDLMEKQEENKSRDKPTHKQDVADVTHTFQNLMKQTDLEKKSTDSGKISSEKQKLLEMLDKTCNNQEAAAEKNLSKNVTKNRFPPGPFHEDGEFNKPQPLKVQLPDTGATKKVLNNGATNTTTKPARGRGNKHGSTHPQATGPQPLLPTGPYPNQEPYPGQAAGYAGPNQQQRGGFPHRGRWNFQQRGRGNHSHHYQRLDNSEYQNQGSGNNQHDGQIQPMQGYPEPGPQQYQNYGPGNFQNSGYHPNQGGDYHNVPYNYQNQDGGYQGRGRGSGYHQESGSSQRGGRGGYQGPDNFQNQGDGGFQGRGRGNHHKRGPGEVQNLGRGGYPNARPGNFPDPGKNLQQTPHTPHQKDERSRPAHARGEGKARSRSTHRGGKTQLTAAESQSLEGSVPIGTGDTRYVYLGQGAYPKNAPSGAQGQTNKPKKNRKPKPRRDEEQEEEGEESKNLNASQCSLEHILGDGQDSVDSDSSIVSAFVPGVFAKKRNKNYAQKKKKNALKKAASVNSLIADKVNPGDSKDSSSEVLQDVVGDPGKTTGSVAGSTASPVVSDAPLQLFLGSGFNEKVAKTMDDTSEIRDVMLVAKAGGEIISCAPKTLGELRAFKVKYPQAEVIVVRSQNE